MPLNLDTWYKISFPGAGRTASIFVSVEDDMGVPFDNIVVELEATADSNVQKLHLNATTGVGIFAICSNGSFCLNGAPGVLYVEEDPEYPMVRVVSLPFRSLWDWMYSGAPGFLQVDLYFSLIAAGTAVNPCDPAQPETADPSPDRVLRTVGAFPAVFAFPGDIQEGGSNTGKKVKVIWKMDV